MSVIYEEHECINLLTACTIITFWWIAYTARRHLSAFSTKNLWDESRQSYVALERHSNNLEGGTLIEGMFVLFVLKADKVIYVALDQERSTVKT